MVRYYGVNGNVSHLAGSQGHYISSRRDHAEATSRRGVCSLEMTSRYYNDHGHRDIDGWMYDDDDEDDDGYGYGYGYRDSDEDTRYPYPFDEGYWE